MTRPFIFADDHATHEAASLLAHAVQLRAIAAELEASAAALPCADDRLIEWNGRAARPDKADVARIARLLYAMRRRRSTLLGDHGLFGEAAWDMLLDLYVAEYRGKRLPVTSACIGSAVPGTTALRWLGALESAGLVQREADPRDARRSHVRITRRGQTAMEDLLSVFAADLRGQGGEREKDQPASRPNAAAPA